MCARSGIQYQLQLALRQFGKYERTVKMKYYEYAGMSYKQAVDEIVRIERLDWFKPLDRFARLTELLEIAQRDLLRSASKVAAG